MEEEKNIEDCPYCKNNHKGKCMLDWSCCFIPKNNKEEVDKHEILYG